MGRISLASLHGRWRVDLQLFPRAFGLVRRMFIFNPVWNGDQQTTSYTATIILGFARFREHDERVECNSFKSLCQTEVSTIYAYTLTSGHTCDYDCRFLIPLSSNSHRNSAADTPMSLWNRTSVCWTRLRLLKEWNMTSRTEDGGQSFLCRHHSKTCWGLLWWFLWHDWGGNRM